MDRIHYIQNMCPIQASPYGPQIASPYGPMWYL